MGMDIIKEHNDRVVEILKVLGIINSSLLDESKLKALCENVDFLKDFYAYYKTVIEANPLRIGIPAFHQKYGVVLIKKLSTGIVEGKLSNANAMVLTLTNGETTVYQKDLIPYNPTSGVLYA